MCDWEADFFNNVQLFTHVSIPERDYVWLRVCRCLYSTELNLFQSLKGIMCDWELILEVGKKKWKVSIPERDYVWLRGGKPYTYQGEAGFNPWKGLCVIESLLDELWLHKI